MTKERVSLPAGFIDGYKELSQMAPQLSRKYRLTQSSRTLVIPSAGIGMKQGEIPDTFFRYRWSVAGTSRKQDFLVRITLVLIGVIVAFALISLSRGVASASPYTPLEWQREVTTEHAIPALRGQRKNVTWIRDRDRNFIDDEIERHNRPQDIVNVIVDLNTCLTTLQIHDLLSKFGHVKYTGKLITFVLLDKLRVDVLPKLAALPQVAMIEWQIPFEPMNDVGSRAIQSRTSTTYSPNTAQDLGFTGAGVNIAIVDTGVDNTHEAFTGKFVAGYNANTDLALLENSNNDSDGHGTHVAGIALGKATSGRRCRKDQSEQVSTDCGGVATSAGLVDVKVCVSSTTCDTIKQGLDWIGTHSTEHHIRVVNISLGMRRTTTTGTQVTYSCPPDDGTSAEAKQVDYLVAMGIAVAIGHGNASFCGYSSGSLLPPVRTPSPGSASFAMTVQGSQDSVTVNRSDDTLFSDSLRGPRLDFNLASPDLLALKPDFSAPAENIISAQAGKSDGYISKTGTSMAAPHVTGTAAVLLQARDTLDPGSLKDLLRRTADSLLNVPPSFPPTYPSLDPVWNNDLGSGIINVYQALTEPAVSDVKFPHCAIGPPVTPGGLCQVQNEPPWNNWQDIVILDPNFLTPTSPQKNVKNIIRAMIQNSGPAATVLVNFGVYEYAAGNKFHHIGTVQQLIPANSTVPVDLRWTPLAADHQCVQVSIQYGLDSDFTNNVTQRNLEVAPSRYKVRIENPFMVPARMEIRPQSSREGWVCTVSETSFMLDPFEDCPRTVQIAFDAPTAAAPGEQANCDVGVYATPKGSDTPILVGGVTAQTFVPKPCRIVGQVVDKTNHPVPQARVTFSRVQTQREASDGDRRAEEGVVSVIAGEPVTAVTDEDGVFSLIIPPAYRYLILVKKAGQGEGKVEQRLECGIGRHTYMLSKDGLKVVEN